MPNIIRWYTVSTDSTLNKNGKDTVSSAFRGDFVVCYCDGNYLWIPIHNSA